jgi:electron transport complex protein RnfC
MIKKSLFGVIPPSFSYDRYGDDFKSVTIQTPDSVTLLIEKEPDFPVTKSILKTGDTVDKNEVLKINDNAINYVVTPISGEIIDISHYSGFYGREHHAIKVKAVSNDKADNIFADFKDKADISNALKYLKGIPGSPDFSVFKEFQIDTVVINCADTDMGVFTNQYILNSAGPTMKIGIESLKSISGNNELKIILAIPDNLIKPDELSNYDHVSVGSKYPSAFPIPICEDLMGTNIPSDSSPEEQGVCFFSSQSVASVGIAYSEGTIPFEKTITVTKKDGSIQFVKADIGTPLNSIFSELGIELKDGDRIIDGGLMTGNTVYSVFQPVLADTDGLIIQDSFDVTISSDTPCINCGDCIRVCPSRIQVSMLVRYIEAGQYEDALDMYDLDSCIECGICSYVCVAKIPVLQFIKLAKHELGLKEKEMEETDA